MQKDKIIEDLKKIISNFEIIKIEFIEDRDKLAKLDEFGIIDSRRNPIQFHQEEKKT